MKKNYATTTSLLQIQGQPAHYSCERFLLFISGLTIYAALKFSDKIFLTFSVTLVSLRVVMYQSNFNIMNSRALNSNMSTQGLNI